MTSAHTVGGSEWQQEKVRLLVRSSWHMALKKKKKVLLLSLAYKFHMNIKSLN